MKKVKQLYNSNIAIQAKSKIDVVKLQGSIEWLEI